MNNLITQNARNWSPLTDLRREMDRLFDDFWALPSVTKGLREMESRWNPVSDVEEEEGHYLISVDMPGVPRDRIKVETQGGQVLISGERGSGDRTVKLQRAFTLPAAVDTDKAEANYQDGVLRLYVPKSESAKPRQIKIGDGSGAGKGFFGRLLGSSKKEEEVAHSSSETKTVKAA